MAAQDTRLDLLFLGSGNAFGSQGRAFSSFLLNDRYLLDCGPTILQQLQRAGIESGAIEGVLISHFHADHFFGLPFLFLDAWRKGRKTELNIAGPPGIAERAEHLLHLAFPGMPERMNYPRRYFEIGDGVEGEVAGLPFTAARVKHVPDLDCFAYRLHPGRRSLVYSGDTTLCEGLLRLVPGAEVLVLECSCGEEAVHLSPAEIEQVLQRAPREARAIVTHLDGFDHPNGFKGLLVASDLARFSL